jgi:uncharacterized membrane protein YfcA
MPVFLYFFKGHAPASFLSFLCIFITSFSAMSVYSRKGLIDWELVKYLGVPLAGMVFMTGFFVRITPNGLLRSLLGGTLVLAAFFMLSPKRRFLNFSRFAGYLNRTFPDKNYPFSPTVLSPLVACIGFLSGMSGVAGGVFEIPIMTQCLARSPQVAVATSSAIVTIVSLSGFLGRMAWNFQNFEMLPIFLVSISLGVFLGGQIGPNISVKLDKKVFKKMCGVFVLSMGVYFIGT